MNVIKMAEFRRKRPSSPDDFVVDPMVYVFDLDGTLANNLHRQAVLPHKEFLLNTEQDIAQFWAEAVNDPPHEPIAEIARSLFDYHEIVVLTSRVETLREQTEDWLERADIPYDDLIMRPVEDQFLHTPIFKVRELKSIQARGGKIAAMFEDHAKVVEAVRAMGIICLQLPETI